MDNPSASRWVIRQWDDGVVVYDRKTGDTHALDPLCAEILALPAEQRTHAARTAEVLANKLSLELDTALRSAVDDALDLLQHKELLSIEKQP